MKEAKKTKTGRKGAVKGRIQALNPKTGKWIKIDRKTSKIISHKKTLGPYKGVTKKKKK